MITLLVPFYSSYTETSIWESLVDILGILFILAQFELGFYMKPPTVETES